MHVALRTRRDIHPTVGVLSGRVNDTTEEDYAKLRRLMKYACGTVEEKCYIGASDLATMINVKFNNYLRT